MRKFWIRRRWMLYGVVLGVGGCVSNQQIFDFTRSEFSRVIADSVGRLFQVFVQATA